MDHDGQMALFERYKSEIYRIGWRIQYRSKKIKKCEHFFVGDFATGNFSTDVEERVLIKQLLDMLPVQGQTIMHKLYFQDMTEAEVAEQIHISQQAVNKWKKKMIQKLSQMINS